MSKFFSRILTVCVVFLSSVTLSVAQEGAGKTILVLDASGSMWGQIDGEAKITIAQRVIGELLETLPEGQQLGLVAYGHRVKGDCSDIETLVPAGLDTRANILAAVNAISPKGKTPLSAAVLAAAQELRYEEDKATVILVSDGRETCNLDPCAIGTELEKSGVDFTAHVVGFDIDNDPQAKAQLQCLAENTGGRFLPASNADELVEALVEIAAPVIPTSFDIILQAQDGPDGKIITEDLVWSLKNTDTDDVVMDHFTAARLNMVLDTGKYYAEVLRTSDESFAELALSVNPEGAKTFTLILPDMTPPASVEGPETAIAGSTVQVTWTGPNDRNDYISVAEIGDRYNANVNYTYTRDGTPLSLMMPPKAGQYELRYVSNEEDEVLASQRITVTEVPATLKASETAVLGDSIIVEWTGPDYKNDYISVAEIGSRNTASVNYSYTRDGNTLTLQMPPKTGEYELRYVMSQNHTVIASKRISVTDVTVTLNAPETATAGESLIVTWEGPDYKNDYISVAEVGARGSSSINYSYTRDGNTLKLQMPPENGTYELRYILSQDHTILASQMITVEDVKATIIAPEEANAGDTIIIEWNGPDYQNDYISVAESGARGSDYINYTYTRDGNILKLEMPATAGEYELRYILNQDHVILTSKPITIVKVGASVKLPETALAGASVVVTWEGPDYGNDYIAIAKAGADSSDYEKYTYTRDGSPLRLTMPSEPGTYEVRYIQNQDDIILASQQVVIEAVSASVKSPATAIAGASVIVEWDGPDYGSDYISIAEVGADHGDYEKYTYTRDGSPLRLEVPAKPGSYEVRYIMNQDSVVLARQTIEVSEVAATLQAPATGTAGQKIVVEWTGPDYSNDYIAISRLGDPDGDYEMYEYTRNGSPVLIELPDGVGEYEVRYVMNSGTRVLARSVITIGN